MSCLLRFSAKNFDVEAYLVQSSLQAVDIFKIGDYQQTALASWLTEQPGFCAKASNADFDNFKQQLQDTSAFILANKQELLTLSQVPDKEYFFFDFGLSTTLFEEDVWVDAFHFPVEFMRLLCEIGANMEISYYYPSSDSESAESD